MRTCRTSAYSAPPERQLIFDINDFDETLPGPWEWDVKRVAASFEVMGRFRGFSADNRRAIVAAGVREYRERMRRAADLPTLGAWYDQLEAAYADQNERDYQAFTAAVNSGRLIAQTGV
jgi:hypothetical protein